MGPIVAPILLSRQALVSYVRDEDLTIVTSPASTQHVRRMTTVYGCASLCICCRGEGGNRHGDLESCGPFVCSMLVLSTFATSIILAAHKGCVDITIGPHRLTIHVDSQCCGPKDYHLDNEEYPFRTTVSCLSLVLHVLLIRVGVEVEGIMWYRSSIWRKGALASVRSPLRRAIMAN